VLALPVALHGSDLAGQSIKVTLLGTGGPLPSLERFGPSTLIEAGGRTFLIDAGRGALQRLAQAGAPWQAVDGVLLTHLHSDHIVGLPDLWLTGWLVLPGRARPLTVWGPRGTTSMLAHFREAFAFDIRLRQSDDGARPAGGLVNPVEVATDDDLIPGTRREYSGRLEIGMDRMTITIGDSIEVRARHSMILPGAQRDKCDIFVDTGHPRPPPRRRPPSKDQS
jgi:ribonuclease BN (tRNA processing enzyme)